MSKITSARWDVRASRIRRFIAGTNANTMMLTAFFIIPMMGLVGSGVDMGRGYLAKTRLQQACDAGVLAGRRAMANNSYTTASKAEASKMFSANYPSDFYGSSKVTFSSSANNSNDVAGTASAQLPMAVMTLFGMTKFDLAVSCVARLEITNSDIMLVLDTTFSMDGTTSDGRVRIDALRDAAKDFFEAITSSGSDGRIRIGMVPYSTTVNVGRILKDANPSWIDDSVELPSRTAAYYSSYYGRWVYRYQNIVYPTVTAKNMTTTLYFPTGDGGSLAGSRWDGCILERATVPFGSTSSPPAGALDMDVDLVPTIDPDTKWKMMLAKFAYPRGVNIATTPSNRSMTGYVDTLSDQPAYAEMTNGFWSCPSEAKKLRTFVAADKATFDGWVDNLTTYGGTYHDAGMAWGVRLLSPEGLFASENTSAPNGRPISRHIIFMTDGELDNRAGTFSHQNYEYVFGRTGSIVETEMEARTANRFRHLCNAAKARNMTVWVVNLGIPGNADLTACASGGNVFTAYSSTQLRAAFKQIAQQISKLRLTE